MRFNAIVAPAVLLFAGVQADLKDDVADAASVVSSSMSAASAAASSKASSAVSAGSEAVESATSTLGERPSFTPVSIPAPFLEQFTDDWDSRWTPSKAKKDDPKTEEDWRYVGEWSVEEPTVYPGIEGDKGLVVKNAAAHHAISAKFPKKIDNKGKTLVVQYEVKLQNDLQCGGAYMKLLQDNKALHAEEFSNASPYIIMFGPDKCGTTNKVHFIFRHKNPKTKEYEEKHMKSAPMIESGKKTHLYTLIVKPDNSFELLVDGENKKNGTLLEDFEPSVNPDKEIEDADDKKPADWVDEARIPDPEATKPADWDEDAPFEIVDTEAEKPEDWDDEEDGDWIPPMVPNPKCEEASGCGKWEPPMKKNPAYKGKWTAEFIDNPAYKGVWKPRLIKNPNFFEDKTPANFEPMGAIGFEIWTMQSDILFDNIYVGHSIEDAAALRAATYSIKAPLETAAEDLDKPKPSEDDPLDPSKKAKSPNDLNFLDDPLLFVQEKGQLFIELFKRDPIEAVRFMPDVAAAAGGVIVTILAIIAGVITLATTSPEVQKKAAQGKEKAKDLAGKAQDKAAQLKDQAVDAVTTGSQKVQEEVNKRVTRSKGPADE